MKIEKIELIVGDTWYFCSHFPEGTKSPDCEQCRAVNECVVSSIDKDTKTVNFDLMPKQGK